MKRRRGRGRVWDGMAWEGKGMIEIGLAALGDTS